MENTSAGVVPSHRIERICAMKDMDLMSTPTERSRQAIHVGGVTTKAVRRRTW